MRRLWIILPLILLLPLSLFAGQPRKPSSEPSRPPEPSAPPWNEPDEFRGLKLGQNVRDQARECPRSPSDTKERCWTLLVPPGADDDATKGTAVGASVGMGAGSGTGLVGGVGPSPWSSGLILGRSSWVLSRW
jgi:hypothetical protein